MIIKEAEYKKVRRITKVRISDEIYGCDCCKKEFKTEKLDLTVFYNDESLIQNKIGRDTDHYDFCSWKCVIKFLPKIKTDYFISLPHLHYYDIENLLKVIKKKK